MKNITLRDVCERLLANDNILLITHKNPDGDAVASVASMYGILKKLGKNVCVVFPDEPVERLGFISGDMEYYTCDNRDKIPFSDFIVSLDCAASSRFGRLEGEFADKVNLSIDHHASNTPFAGETYTKADASATCEIIYDIFTELVAIGAADFFDSDIFYKIYAGIASDTGNFKYSNTTSHTFRACAELFEYGIDIAEISRLLFDSTPLNKLKAEAIAAERLEVFANGKAAIVTIPKSVLEENGLTYEDFDDCVNVARRVSGVEIGAYVRVSDMGGYKISLRANAYADVAAICAKYNGGGHIRAAGCTVVTDGIDEATKIIKKEIETVLN